MSRSAYTGRLPPSQAPSALLLQTACRIAAKYSRRLPTVAELQGEFGMHRATAYRWVAAIRAARVEHQMEQKTNDNWQGSEDDKRP